MNVLSPSRNLALNSLQHAAPDMARDVFFSLFDGRASHRELHNAESFLNGQLERAAAVDSDLPLEMEGLGDWMESNVESVGKQYHDYLEERKAGGARRFFRNKSHALYFLKSVAPTKLVDGAWLYGLLEHWQDIRFSSLIKTYLEELGEGLPDKNHVVLYKKLLAAQECEHWDELSDEHYVQGAIQLALAYHVDRFLPEIIGYNLGYEQLPLHLLITAYELKELHIDPYYFTLHITVDNADSGHAKKAVEAVFDAMPKMGDSQDFYNRVRNGYQLNFLGANTNSVIASFDIEKEMQTIFSRKGAIGQYAHSDYRRIGGRTVNEWLSDSNQSANVIAAMEAEGWFTRHQDPQNSRFWKLIQSEKAKMFGVFNAYEQQVIYDWIVGDAANDGNFDAKRAINARATLSEEEKQKLRRNAAKDSAISTGEGSDFDAELRALQKNLATAESQKETMQRLIGLMSPAHHHSPPGLMATRMFNEILG